MEFNEYNESVKNWTNGILDNYRKDAELTIRYCHELIDYGEKDEFKDLGLRILSSCHDTLLPE